MSTKTSHRRQARGRRTVDQFVAELNVDTRRVCRGKCRTQCDECHDIDNCVPATTQYADLLLCKGCRSNHPAVAPWGVDPATGEFVSLTTGAVL